MSEIVLFENAEDIFFAHDLVFNTVDLDLAAGILAEQNPVANLHIHGQHGSVFGHFTLANRLDDALLGLLFGGIGDDDASGRGGFLFYSFNDDTIPQRSDVHVKLLSLIQ